MFTISFPWTHRLEILKTYTNTSNVNVYTLSGINKKYSETVVPRVGKAVCELFDVDNKTIMEMFGVTFVTFVGKLKERLITLVSAISSVINTVPQKLPVCSSQISHFNK